MLKEAKNPEAVKTSDEESQESNWDSRKPKG